MNESKLTQTGKRLVSAEVKTTGELHPVNRNGERKCAYECECKKCERCSNCDYTVNGLRKFHWRGDKLVCEKCLWGQQVKKQLTTLKGITTSSFSKRKELVVLRGRTSSQINQALRAENPYPARVFLKVDNQEQDIPVFFRINEEILCPHHKKYFSDLGWRNCCPWYCHGKLGGWIKPKIKKGSYLQVEGYFSIGTVYTKQGERKSFTATSYQLLNQEQAKILSHVK